VLALEADVVKKVIVIVVAVLLLAGGGAGGWWWWSQRAQAAGQDEAGGTPGGSRPGKKKGDTGETGAIVLEPFLVNLADKDASRFLRLSLQLVIDKKELAEAMSAKGEAGAEQAIARARLRSGILELLTTKTSDALVTAEGKTALKKEIAARATQVLAEAEVTDVLFTDFVVQF